MSEDPAVRSISDRLAACYTGVVHDVMNNDLGLADFTLPPEIRPILPEKAIAGPAFTIVGEVTPGADFDATLLAWTGLLSKAPPGSIWVAQPNDRVVAHMGELSAEALLTKGVRGAVIDGFIRDVNFILALGFQCWCRGFTPRDIAGYWMPKATDVAIRIGAVTIEPGDYMVGDRDGMIRVPKGIVETVIAKSEAAIATESAIRRAILSGVDPQEAFLKYGKF